MSSKRKHTIPQKKVGGRTGLFGKTPFETLSAMAEMLESALPKGASIRDHSIAVARFLKKDPKFCGRKTVLEFAIEVARSKTRKMESQTAMPSGGLDTVGTAEEALHALFRVAPTITIMPSVWLRRHIRHQLTIWAEASCG